MSLPDKPPRQLVSLGCALGAPTRVYDCGATLEVTIAWEGVPEPACAEVIADRVPTGWQARTDSAPKGLLAETYRALRAAGVVEYVGQRGEHGRPVWQVA